jgi:hypothetical protein
LLTQTHNNNQQHNASEHNREVAMATTNLRTERVEQLALHLMQRFTGMESNLNFSSEFHKFGVNVRFCGLVRTAITNLLEVEHASKKKNKHKDVLKPQHYKNGHRLQWALLMEMTSRCCKLDLLRYMRCVPEKQSFASVAENDAAVRDVVYEYFRLITGINAPTLRYFAGVRRRIQRKFEQALTRKEVLANESLRHIIDIDWIKRRVQQSCGVRVQHYEKKQRKKARSRNGAAERKQQRNNMRAPMRNNMRAPMRDDMGMRAPMKMAGPRVTPYAGASSSRRSTNMRKKMKMKAVRNRRLDSNFDDLNTAEAFDAAAAEEEEEQDQEPPLYMPSKMKMSSMK